MELYLRVRLAVSEGMTKRQAAKHFNISRDTVAKMMSYSVPPGYRRQAPVRRPKLEAFIPIIDQCAYSNATGRCFRLITGHPFQFDAGRDSDAKPDSLRLLWAHLMFVFDRVAGQAGVVPASEIFFCLRKLSPESSMR